MIRNIILFVIVLIISIMPTLEAQNIFKDKRDNKTYKTVIIGNQIWMSENLNYETEKGSWAYDDNVFNAGIYGQLYTWEIASEVCPDGWHLPSNNEWEELLIYLDLGAGKYDDKKFLVANKIKKDGVGYWNWSEKKLLNNPEVTNESRFTALPGGVRDPHGNFYFMGGEAHFWSSSKIIDKIYGFDEHYYFRMTIQGEFVEKKKRDDPSALSVRCIKDK